MNRNRTVGRFRQAPRLAVVDGLERRVLFAADLTDSVSIVVRPSQHLTLGGNVTLSVTVSNAGTSTAAGPLATDLSLSANADGSAPDLLGSVTRHINLRAGAHVTLRFTEKLSSTLSPDTYFGVANVDPGNTFAESDTTNNLAVSASAVQVSPKYQIITGTWAGTSTLTTGLDKGLTFDTTFTITSEDQSNGTFAFTGTNTFSNDTSDAFTGTGRLTTAGTYTQSNDGAGGPSHGHGKLIGNTLTSVFINLHSTGTGLSTLQT